jgi:DNA-binding transcriptional MerR regulator
VHAADLDKALAAIDAGHAGLDRERAQITAVLGAFDSLVSLPSDRPGRLVRIGAVARQLGVRASALRLWEERGLLRPVRQPGTAYRLYDAAEVRNARIVALLRKGNYPLAIVEAVMGELRTTGSPGRVRAELYRREQEVRRRSLSALRGTAALSAYLAVQDLP